MSTLIKELALVYEKKSLLAYLQCSECGEHYPADQLNTFSTCETHPPRPLVTHYNFIDRPSKDDIDQRDFSMWRYFSMLPVFDPKNIVTLGEGFTPIFSLDILGKQIGMPNLLMKDESDNPTGSFKARGMSAAISKANELGVTKCIVPTAGNAGSALAAYCAKANMHATVVMPTHTPEVFKKDCQLYGAEVIFVEGLISDCAKRVAEINREGEYFNLSTMKEPYRLEGKKTMGYEIAEQLNWTLPDVILYPTGGGTGLIGIWKAFREMQDMGWIDCSLPRMIAVQTEACQPVVQTWFHHQQNCKNYVGKSTIANGLAVPNPFGEDLMIQVLKESNGTAIAVSDESILKAVYEIGKKEGRLISPEGAALWAALPQLLNSGFIQREEKVLLLNTGTGYKYLDNF